MSGSALIDLLVSKLKTANYGAIQTPFAVANVAFSFEAAFVGHPPRSSDLVVIVDTSVTEEAMRIGERTKQKLQALSRALDVTGSNLVLTAILAGAILPPNQVDAISRICRVLAVNENPELVPEQDRKAAWLDFEDRIRSLLPLPDSALDDEVADPLTRTLHYLSDDGARKLYQSLTNAQNASEHAVRSVLINTLDFELSKGLLR